jgi:hypothetical protein
MLIGYFRHCLHGGGNHWYPGKGLVDVVNMSCIIPMCHKSFLVRLPVSSVPGKSSRGTRNEQATPVYHDCYLNQGMPREGRKIMGLVRGDLEHMYRSTITKENSYMFMEWRRRGADETQTHGIAREVILTRLSKV